MNQGHIRSSKVTIIFVQYKYVQFWRFCLEVDCGFEISVGHRYDLCGNYCFFSPGERGSKIGLRKRPSASEETFKNGGLDRGAVNKVRQAIANARKFRNEGKYKKCVAIVNNVNKQLGTK